jgi:hypothetical protein
LEANSPKRGATVLTEPAEYILKEIDKSLEYYQETDNALHLAQAIGDMRILLGIIFNATPDDRNKDTQ